MLPIVLLFFGISLGVGLLLWRHGIEAALLRADPTTLLAAPRLIGYAQQRGESIFATQCSGCHGEAGRGNHVSGTPDLRDNDWMYGMGTISDIERVVSYGIRSHRPRAWNLAIMPAYGTAHPSARDTKIPPLSPGNIRDLVDFLQDLKNKNRLPADGATSATVARGAALYAGVGGCYDCHGPDGKGDPAIGAPNLTDQVALYDGSSEGLLQSISFGRAGVCPAWLTRLGPVGVREVAVYVYLMSHMVSG